MKKVLEELWAAFKEDMEFRAIMNYFFVILIILLAVILIILQ
jgi:hypothetical protein